MRALAAALALALAQDRALEVDTSFQGTPAEALLAVVRLAESEPERAAVLAEGFAVDAQHPEALRAEFRFAQGVVLAGAGGDAAAAPAFASARALAGPGELRVAAAYNQGTAELRAAEALRMETFRRMQDPAAGAAPPASGGDPLRALRDAYLRAKATLLERLRADFSGADTRANLELIQRRLRELERQAEEERQEQQEEQPEQQAQEGEQDEQQKGEAEEQQQEGEQGREGEQEEQPGEQQEEPDPSAADPADPLQPQEPSGELPEVKPGDPAAGEPAERVLAREEVLRLLDRLGELEAEAQALEALLRASQRIPVDKDW